MRTRPETEMKIVASQLERVGHLNTLQRPAAVGLLHILGTVLHPDPDIPLRLFSNHKWIDIAAILFARLPLNGREARNARDHAAEQIRQVPCRIERADSARRITCNGMV